MNPAAQPHFVILDFPSHKTGILDHEATTPLVQSRFLFSMTFSYFSHLHFTPILSPSSLNEFPELYAYPNQTPTLPTRHLFLPQKALLR